MKSHRGFTLTELVIVLIITGVLAAVAIPRLFSQNEFAARAAHDFVVNGLRYAQKTAIATRRLTCISFTSTNVVVVQSDGLSRTCAAAIPVLNTVNGLPYADVANAMPGGMTFSGTPAGFSFTPNGTPQNAVFNDGPLASQQVISVSGYSQAITIEPESGLIR